MQDSRPTILLVPGAWHGVWAWERTRRELVAQNWAVAALDLPSTADPDSGPRSGLHDDAEVVRRHVNQIEGPVVIVAHSYGGAVVSEAAARLPNVRYIVFVCAFLADIGESLQGLLAGHVPPFFGIDGDIIYLNGAREHFYHDVPAEVADRAVEQIKPVSRLAFTEPLTDAAWRTVPSTYVVCDLDASWPDGAQEFFANRATNIRHLPSSHSPQLSMPVALTKLIVEAAESVAGQ